MQISKVRVKNFRLLADVEMALEDLTTVIVGRNNSGKTSLAEIMRRFLIENYRKFQIEDFSCSCYDNFWEAYESYKKGESHENILKKVPSIELSMTIIYDITSVYGLLSQFIVELDPNCNEVLIVSRYELNPQRVEAFFMDEDEGVPCETPEELFRLLRERLPENYDVSIWTQDPNDCNNQRRVELKSLRTLIMTDFINAQRGLDDNTYRDTDILAALLVSLFEKAEAQSEETNDKKIAAELAEAVRDIQSSIDDDFKTKLELLLPTLETFGYPGLGGPKLITETALDVKKLLSDHTKVGYAGYCGVRLPESYNGLGMRNLIFILFQLVKAHRAFSSEKVAPGIHLIFIEEPEAHMHPQMQEVFIRQLKKLVDQMNGGQDGNHRWPVQFIVSTHSSHIANQASIEAIRYFLSSSDDETAMSKATIKDFRQGLEGISKENKEFFHQYMTQTRCDLFFADKAILVEGTSERLLLPSIIKKLENSDNNIKLSSQYLTILEVGGAHAHIFFALLDFLELRTLIITDLDSANEEGHACVVHSSVKTTNTCLNKWFSSQVQPQNLLCVDEAAKIQGLRRIAFQLPEDDDNTVCGRTFEDAFMFANPEQFTIKGNTPEEKEQKALDEVSKLKKTDFALEHAMEKTDWKAPRYIIEGLEWLAHSSCAGDSSIDAEDASDG